MNLTFTITSESDGIILREKYTIQQDGSSAVTTNLSCILAVNHSYSLTVEVGDGYQVNTHVFGEKINYVMYTILMINYFPFRYICWCDRI